MTTILLDLFGTLLDHSSAGADPSYPRTSTFLRKSGLEVGADWTDRWDAVHRDHERRSAEDLSEFSMEGLATSFLAAEGVTATPELVAGLVETYLAEWSRPIGPFPGVGRLLDRLRADHHTLVLVSNTHSTALVEGLLDRYDLGAPFAAAVLSVELGVRKPHPRIYEHALATVDAPAAGTIFVGDTYDADFEGPRAVGMDAFHLGSDARVPADRQLTSVLDLEAHLAALDG